MADQKKPVVGKIEQLTAGPVDPHAPTSHIITLDGARRLLDPVQFEQLRATIIEAAVINGFLSCGSRPSSPANIETLRKLIATVKEQVL
jgi:hypothetical protein